MRALTFILMVAAVVVLGISDTTGNFHDRVKRQAAPPSMPQWMEVVKCCPFPMILTTESKTGCFTQPPAMPGGPLLPNWANQGCDIECAYKKQGLINSDNGVDISALSARVAELVASTPKWATVINNAFTSCTKDNPPVLQTSSECKTGAGEMSQCLTGNLLNNCPAEAADPSPKCTEILNAYRVSSSG